PLSLHDVLPIYDGAHGFNLFFRDRNSFTTHTNDSANPGQLSYPHPIFVCGDEMNEQITAEERQFHFFSPVAPTVDLSYEWQKCRYALLTKSRSNHFFVS